MVDTKKIVGKLSGHIKNPLEGKAKGVGYGLDNPLVKSPKMSGNPEAKTSKSIKKFLGK